jgi:hypothetical protein
MESNILKLPNYYKYLYIFLFLHFMRSISLYALWGPSIHFYPVSCPLLQCERFNHLLINYLDTKANCRHLKKLTCKWTLQ